MHNDDRVPTTPVDLVVARAPTTPPRAEAPFPPVLPLAAGAPGNNRYMQPGVMAIPHVMLAVPGSSSQSEHPSFKKTLAQATKEVAKAKSHAKAAQTSAKAASDAVTKSDELLRLCEFYSDTASGHNRDAHNYAMDGKIASEIADAYSYHAMVCSKSAEQTLAKAREDRDEALWARVQCLGLLSSAKKRIRIFNDKLNPEKKAKQMEEDFLKPAIAVPDVTLQ